MLEDQRFLAAETPCPPGQVKCNKDSKEVQAANEFAKKQGQAKVREMIVDMMAISENLYHIVVFSGDGDFRYAIEKLQERGKRVTVISSEGSIANELKR